MNRTYVVELKCNKGKKGNQLFVTVAPNFWTALKQVSEEYTNKDVVSIREADWVDYSTLGVAQVDESIKNALGIYMDANRVSAVDVINKSLKMFLNNPLN